MGVKKIQIVVPVGTRRIKTTKEEENGASILTEKKRKKTTKNTQKSSKPTGHEEVDYYVQRRVPALVIWYLPVVDRLRCLFANPEDA
jgi:hypothetical protein